MLDRMILSPCPRWGLPQKGRLMSKTWTCTSQNGEYDMVSSLKTGFPIFKELQGLLFCDTRVHKERLDISAQTLSWNFWVFLESLSPWGIIHRCSWSQDRTRRKAGSPWYLSMGARYFCRADLWWSLWKSPKNRCWSVIFHFLVLYIWLYSNIFRFIMTGWWCNVPILKNDGLRQFCQDDIPYGKSSKCLKPPTRWFYDDICPYIHI